MTSSWQLEVKMQAKKYLSPENEFAQIFFEIG
jgi:hypothetical protein